MNHSRPPDDPIAREPDQFGEIIRLDLSRGFGFIASGGQELFFHAKSAFDFDSMAEGDRVKFQAITSTKGPRAVQVRRVNA
jgi:cold shock CspA family protein